MMKLNYHAERRVELIKKLKKAFSKVKAEFKEIEIHMFMQETNGTNYLKTYFIDS